MNALVAVYPRRQSAREIRSRNAVINVVKYLLPGWSQAREWLTGALDAARRVHGRRVVKLDAVTILAQWLQPADLDNTFATVVVTKRDSLDEWKWPDD